ncbi:MAG: hypothetical protein WAK17_20520 [Candidatus Nitrosopolaris sp.]|jgi:hypothetical protein
MNKPILMATVALVTLMGSAFALPAFQMVNAQGYGGGGSLQGGGIEQQLKLAREKVSAVQGAASIGLGNSGTPMLGTNINSTLLFIIAMVVIFGGVSVAFFIRARSPSKEATA